jgi:hypothetical protein
MLKLNNKQKIALLSGILGGASLFLIVRILMMGHITRIEIFSIIIAIILVILMLFIMIRILH